jgi:hypothetical protein
MTMDEEPDSKLESHRQRTKARVIGMLFGRDKKPATTTNATNDTNNVSDFLHGNSDKLHMTGAAPPRLPKLDVSMASRWPTAAEVNRLRDTSRGRSVSLKRGRKGLNVRFTDSQPEIIGEGGDEAEAPTVEISARRRAHSHPPILQQFPATAVTSEALGHGKSPTTGSFSVQLKPSSDRDEGLNALLGKDLGAAATEVKGDTSGKVDKPSDDHADISFAARVQANMRRAEGEAFRRASRVYVDPTEVCPDTSSPLEQGAGHSLPIRPVPQGHSPIAAPLPSSLVPGGSRPGSSGSIQRRPVSAPQNESPQTPTTTGSATSRPHASTSPTSGQAGKPVDGTKDADVLDDFSDRIHHFYKLFQLSAESIVPLGQCSLESLMKAACWWFLKGKSSLDNAARSRPSSSNGQDSYSTPQQQAHSDIGKSVWIMGSVLANCSELSSHSSASSDEVLDMLHMCQAIQESLRDIAMFMKTHNMMPPPVDEAVLPQGLDNSIWVTYPLLSETLRGLLYPLQSYTAAQGNRSQLKISQLLPLKDSSEVFSYAKMFVDMTLLDGSTDYPRNLLPCMLFVTRSQKEADLRVTISSQNDLILLPVTSNPTNGPTWADVQWQSRLNALDLPLLHGLTARVQLSPYDFKTLWNMYDYTVKVHASLSARKGEVLRFENRLKVFQYFDHDRQSRTFPKYPIPDCVMRLFEKRTESGSTGQEKRHGGHRIAVITGTTTKSLSGVTHDSLHQTPLQYGFVRGDGDAPAFLLKFDDGTKKPTMVFTFNNAAARSELQRCLTGGPMRDERIIANLPLKAFSMTDMFGLPSTRMTDALGELEWQGLTVINKAAGDRPDPERVTSVQSPNLRVILNARAATLIDRIYVQSGELKFRLSRDPSDLSITVGRQIQEDLGVALVESQVAKDTPQKMVALQEQLAQQSTLRRYLFRKLEDVHSFQAALTGFTVLFDAVAQSLAISRGRSVVHLHKKWEASPARIQIVRRDKAFLLAVYFDDFGYGQCLNLALRVTDNYESMTRSGRSCVRLVDAKVAMPKAAEGDTSAICLDMLEFASECEDITIAFEQETGKWSNHPN